MSPRWMCPAAACVLALAACGSAAPPAPPAPPLSVTSPVDGGKTLASEVLVRGSVGSGAGSVLVAGRPATVRAGSFSAWVPIAPGANVIDVLAGVPRAADAMTLVRVYRVMPATVPDVTSEDPGTAARDLAGVGLRAQVQGSGGFFQSLLPFMSQQVCAIDPPAGSQLAPGSWVTLQVARIC
jgi:Glucodextranase, domain B/PASTA domain